MVKIYKRKFGTYKLVGTANSESSARSSLTSRFGKGRFRIGKSYYIQEK
ncbi:MAG TPA: hypothetical protein PLG47_04105 [Candidatus Dojkabacteria bacterium]|nr:hypothetical protein [Candidatus Dojkabacteria bacterium]